MIEINYNLFFLNNLRITMINITIKTINVESAIIISKLMGIHTKRYISGDPFTGVSIIPIGGFDPVVDLA